jgi:hypothetical protein
VQANSGFDIDIHPDVETIPDPAEEELNQMYNLDPDGIVLA